MNSREEELYKAQLNEGGSFWIWMKWILHIVLNIEKNARSLPMTSAEKQGCGEQAPLYHRKRIEWWNPTSTATIRILFGVQ